MVRRTSLIGLASLVLLQAQDNSPKPYADVTFSNGTTVRVFDFTFGNGIYTGPVKALADQTSPVTRAWERQSSRSSAILPIVQDGLFTAISFDEVASLELGPPKCDFCPADPRKALVKLTNGRTVAGEWLPFDGFTLVWGTPATQTQFSDIDLQGQRVVLGQTQPFAIMLSQLASVRTEAKIWRVKPVTGEEFDLLAPRAVQRRTSAPRASMFQFRTEEEGIVVRVPLGDIKRLDFPNMARGTWDKKTETKVRLTLMSGKEKAVSFENPPRGIGGVTANGWVLSTQRLVKGKQEYTEEYLVRSIQFGNSAQPTTNSIPTKRTAPVPILTPEPLITKEIERGTIESKLQILSDGTVGEVTILKGVNAEVDAIVRKTIQGWKFKPATEDGKPIAFEANVKTEVGKP